MPDGLVERLRRGHEPRTAQLDQDGGATGKVCIGHGMGYTPSWPCLYVEAADEIERLRAKVALQEAILDAVNDDIGSDYLDVIAEGLGEIDV